MTSVLAGLLTAVYVLLVFAAYFGVLWLWGTVFGTIDGILIAAVAAFGIYYLGMRYGQGRTP